MASQLFIAYTVGDRQTAGIVRTGLAKGGICSWAAFRDAPVGIDRNAAIQAAFDSSEACLVILSPYSDNEALTEQVKRAREREMPLFVLSLANVFPPYALAEVLRDATTVVADLTPSEAQIAYLVQTLQAALPQSFRDESLIAAEEAVAPMPAFPRTPPPEETASPAQSVLSPLTQPAAASEVLGALPEPTPVLFTPVASAPSQEAPLEIPTVAAVSPLPETSATAPMFTGEYGVPPARPAPVAVPAVPMLFDLSPTPPITPATIRTPARNRALLPILIGGGLALLAAFFGIALLIFHHLSFSDWKAFAPAGGEFTAWMPGSPLPQTRAGVGVAMVIYNSTDGKSQYIVSYFDLGAGTDLGETQQALDALKKLKVSTLQGTLAEEHNVTAGSQSGLEFILQKPQGVAMKDMRFRIFIINNRVFQLEAMGDEMALHSPDTDKFFDSFRAPGT